MNNSYRCGPQSARPPKIKPFRKTAAKIRLAWQLTNTAPLTQPWAGIGGWPVGAS
jgi:hypothetical protein